MNLDPEGHVQGVPARTAAEAAHGFAVGPTGDDYLIYEVVLVYGQVRTAARRFGAVDPRTAAAGDVAVAVDPASGHLYVDDQSSVAEWDTGAMNGNTPIPNTDERETSAALVSRFGSSQLSGSSGQGGIAVDGASGEIYVLTGAATRAKVRSTCSAAMPRP